MLYLFVAEENVKQMENMRLEIMGQEKLCAKDNKKLKQTVNNVETSFRQLELDWTIENTKWIGLWTKL